MSILVRLYFSCNAGWILSVIESLKVFYYLRGSVYFVSVPSLVALTQSAADSSVSLEQQESWLAHIDSCKFHITF